MTRAPKPGITPNPAPPHTSHLTPTKDALIMLIFSVCNMIWKGLASAFLTDKCTHWTDDSLLQLSNFFESYSSYKVNTKPTTYTCVLWAYFISSWGAEGRAAVGANNTFYASNTCQSHTYIIFVIKIHTKFSYKLLIAKIFYYLSTKTNTVEFSWMFHSNQCLLLEVHVTRECNIM